MVLGVVAGLVAAAANPAGFAARSADWGVSFAVYPLLQVALVLLGLRLLTAAERFPGLFGRGAVVMLASATAIGRTTWHVAGYPVVGEVCLVAAGPVAAWFGGHLVYAAARGAWMSRRPVVRSSMINTGAGLVLALVVSSLGPRGFGDLGWLAVAAGVGGLVGAGWSLSRHVPTRKKGERK